MPLDYVDRNRGASGLWRAHTGPTRAHALGGLATTPAVSLQPARRLPGRSVRCRSGHRPAERRATAKGSKLNAEHVHRLVASAPVTGCGLLASLRMSPLATSKEEWPIRAYQ